LRAAQALLDQGVPATVAARAYFVPGRIEVLGKHTDYAGGRSLTCAVERGFSLIAVPGEDASLRVTTIDKGETAMLALDVDLEQQPGHWSNYARTVARRIAHNFPGDLRGGRIALASTLPEASGMSSSSALVVGLFLALRDFNHLDAHPAYKAHILTCEDLAHYLGGVEGGWSVGTLAGDRGVGTFGGSEDHTALLCSAPGQLRCYRYAPTRFERAVPMPEGYVFAIGVSGVVAEKTGAALASYNRAAQLAAAAADVWRGATGNTAPHLATILAEPDFDLGEMRYLLRRAEASVPGVLDRFEQFYLEDQHVIPMALDALAAGDMDTFGQCVAQSQEAAERWLSNQIPETMSLVREARAIGAVAASAFGAGFGGAVWAMVRSEKAPAFLKAWETRYAEQFAHRMPQTAFFLERPGPAAFSVVGD
jgi:galactokinase